MEQPTDRQIVSALEDSGFLFEHSCATMLEGLGFHVETGWPFADPDQSKSRELDLRAVRSVLNDKQARIQVFVELLVECKNYEAPLVFLQRPKNKRELESPESNEVRFPRAAYRKTLGHNSFTEEAGFEHFELASSHYYHREPLKATQFMKIVRKGKEWVANHDGIYDALVLPLAKALETRRSSLKGPAPRPGDWAYIWLFFPVVLVKNRLLTVDPESQHSLTQHGRVTHVRSLDMPPLRGPYVIDFVSFDSLKGYIESEVMAFASAVCEVAKTKTRLVRGEA